MGRGRIYACCCITNKNVLIHKGTKIHKLHEYKKTIGMYACFCIVNQPLLIHKGTQYTKTIESNGMGHAKRPRYVNTYMHTYGRNK